MYIHRQIKSLRLYELHSKPTDIECKTIDSVHTIKIKFPSKCENKWDYKLAAGNEYESVVFIFFSHLHSFRSMSIINYSQYPNISAVWIVRRNRYLARYWHSMPIQHCWMKWLSAANTSFLSKSTPNWRIFRVRCMLVDNAFVFNELSGSCLIVCLCWKTCLHFFRKKIT